MLRLKNQKGFTLIEIIAVLVILGILAAVAIPKFMDMADQARIKAVQGALAAGTSEVSMKWANLLLINSGNATPTLAAAAATASSATMGDFTFSYTATGNNVAVNVTGPGDRISGVDNANLTKTMILR